MPFIGPPITETFANLYPEKADEMVSYYRAYTNEHHDELILEYDGVYEAIRALSEEDYKLAIVSTKIYDTVMRGLKVMGLDKFFQLVIGFDQVQAAKPDPEGINMALTLLNALPDEAIMIGDNYHDILAGKNAGVKTAGVAWSIKGEAFLNEYKPDYMLHSMGDLIEIVREEED